MKFYIAAAILLVLSLTLVGVVASFTPFFESLELKNYDFMLFLRGPLETPDDIILVGVDQQSISELSGLGIGWPWPRGIYAELIRIFNQGGARAAAFDVVFDLESDPGQDQAMAEAIRDSSIPVILAATIDYQKDPRFNLEIELYPIEAFLNAGARPGFALLNPDRDSVIRHARLTVKGQPTLSAQTYKALGNTLDPAKLPVVRREGSDPEILIRYVGQSGSIPTVSAYQALDFEASLPEGIFQGKTVLVGRTAAVQELGTTTSQADLFNSPFGVGGEQLMPGVEIHANILSNLQSGHFIRQAPAAISLLATLLLGLLVTAIMLVLKNIRNKMIASVLCIVGFLVLSWVAFLNFDYWILSVQPVAMAALVLSFNTLYQYRVSEREKAHIRKALKGYISTQVMERVLEHPERLELGGEQVEATVLFSDIAGFSKISEKITPRELSALLNDYFSKMGDAIMEREGMINKYIGDAIMAIWGAPLPNERHAILACQAALEMKRLVGEMPDLNARIGLNTGTMVAGNLGHHERMEYTVIGDAVNLASRLEGANKAFGTSIMVSEFTEEKIRGHFLVRQLDWIRVIGKQQPIRVYEVIAGVNDSVEESVFEMIRSFEQILARYTDRDWEGACQAIERHLTRFPDDTVVYKTYQKRCQTFCATPPPTDWDGVYAMESK